MLPAVPAVISALQPAQAPIKPALRWLAAGCALLVWMLGLLAASPQLHGTVHDDASHAGHSCAITLFSHGVDESLGSIDFVVTPALFPTGEVVALAIEPTTDAHVRLPPGCGPPLR